MNGDAGRKAIFLDRDGVINHDPGDYTTSLAEFTILPDVIEVLKAWTELGYSIVVITNQGGIAKGRYSVEDFFQIDSFMREEFAKAHIAFVETYFCPHHDAVGRCLCRKPGSAMVEKALARHKLCADLCFMIGDKYRDIEAAEAAGVKGIKVDVNQSLRGIDLNEASQL